MGNRTPESRATQIQFFLSKHGLPGDRTFLYRESTGLPSELTRVAEGGSVGIPVACCVTDADQWTLLGTEGISGRFEGRTNTVLFDAVLSTDLAPRHGSRARPGIKEELARSGKPVCLEIRDVGGRAHEFGFPTLSEQCAFWNIIKRMCRKAP